MRTHSRPPATNDPSTRKRTAALAAFAIGSALLAAVPTAEASPPPPTRAVAPDDALFDINEATIAEITAALESGTVTSVELTAMYLNRIARYDHGGTALNSIVVMNERLLEEAARMDRLRAEGEILGPLHGIPFTVKDSYKVAGLTVASGSPALKNLVANEDAFPVQAIRAAGGILIGKTNMPPMANGGMQRGEYGRAESPYNADYLTAAWGSGSSNGSGTSTGANLATFGMGEETVSSGRSPAANNGLVAYTPSRGMISIRGNWPLWPTRDVVVPHTRTVEDTFTVLDVLMEEDERPDGDFWLTQPFVDLPDVEDVRPEDFAALKDENALEGKRIGVPRIYLNKEPDSKRPIQTRQSIIDLWERTANDLRALGAEVVEVDFPLVTNYFEDLPGAQSMYTRGYVPEAWRSLETGDYSSFWWEKFLKSNNDPNYPSWSVVDPAQVFPHPSRLPANPEATAASYANRITAIKERMPKDLFAVEGLADAVAGWDRTREEDFDTWLDDQGLDLLAFPSVADIGKANADINVASNTAAHAYGVGRSATDHVLRQFGIPSVSVPMGLLEDIKMPTNVTFAGKPYTDPELLAYAYAYEQGTHYRPLPVRTPALPQDRVELVTDEALRPDIRSDVTPPTLEVRLTKLGWSGPSPRLEVTVEAEDASGIDELWVTANGDELSLQETEETGTYQAMVLMDRYHHTGDTGPVAKIRLAALVRDGQRNAAAYTDTVKTREPDAVAPGSPRVAGKVRVGERVTAEPGSWPAGTTYTYRWRVDGRPVAGATGRRFRLAPAHVDKRLTVEVTGRLEGAAPSTATSARSTVAPGRLTAPRPAIRGTARVGQRLTARAGAWRPAPTRLAYRWYADGKRIRGVTRSWLVLGKAHAGKRIVVRVTGTKRGYRSVTEASRPTDEVRRR